MNSKTLISIGLTHFFRLLYLTFLAFCANIATAGDFDHHPEYKSFVKKMVSQHQFEKAEIDRWFANVSRQQSILDAIQRPAEKTLNWPRYRAIFIEPSRIQQGITFWQQHQDILAAAENQFGVPPEIIVAIIGVETRYGRHAGRYAVLDALATLGFEYPPRSKFFLSELENFLLLVREQSFDPGSLKGSYAGAMGMGQFISSSYRHYAVDFDQDGQINLFSNVSDAIGSVANYFARHGWQAGQPIAYPAEVRKTRADKKIMGVKTNHTVASLLKKKILVTAPVGLAETTPVSLVGLLLETENDYEYWLGLKNFYVITRYNHSHLYAMAVYQLSQAIKQGFRLQDSKQ